MYVPVPVILKTPQKKATQASGIICIQKNPAGFR
jgi:hypothetical protein